jgi:AcrR family transcriptional regulator
VKRLLHCRIVGRREDLAGGALAYVLEHGLIGLSLRPLAAALGTSDRMLIYHFGSKEGLITDVVALANQQLAASLTAVDPATVPIGNAGDLVRHVWQALTDSPSAGAMRLYLEMCVLSARDPARWSAAQRQIRGPWLDLIREVLGDLGTPAARIAPLADLVLDTFDGLLLDRLIGTDPARTDAAAAAFADLLARGPA